MLFNSVLFLIFFTIVYFVYWGLTGRARKYFLIAASILFYAIWGLRSEGLPGIRWTLHFLFINIVNYLLIHRMLDRPDRKRSILMLLIGVDLANLAFFKYFYFFLDLIHFSGLTVPKSLSNLDIFLPLAISFYTFILIAYAVDVYRGVITQRVGPVHFAIFVLFFPHLIAGPIMRHSDFMHQIDHPSMSKERMYAGLWLLLSGTLKKAVLADPMGEIIAPIFASPSVYDGWTLLFAGMGFSLQVYADFSGYTDMARGAARLLGYDIPENFRAPFFAKSARELWQRWHITLATWLRDYIYIPLGGSRVSEHRVYLNYLVTFTLGGFWHGADYTYLAWGGFWGGLLAFERFLEKRVSFHLIPKNRVGDLFRVGLMFLLFSVGAIMFRSQRVVTPVKTISSGEIMSEMLSGIVLSAPDSIAREYIASGGDETLMRDIFGPEIFGFESIGRYDSIAIMFIAMLIFHSVQERPERFAALRKYDPLVILSLGAITGGLILPIISSGSHQFIYFVF
jgi:D-alanyl-lipoteichoic acid acyltransferase DltB (MBOAT superfamily)